MPGAICDTSPLLYLYRMGGQDWLPKLFSEVWIPPAVVRELRDGRDKGYAAPNPDDYDWLKIVSPRATPSEWLSLDLGPGELEAMALALENPVLTVLLDDMLARRTAQAAGLAVWGTLKILLEAKGQGLIARVEPVVNRLSESGLWVSNDIRRRIIALAGEEAETRR